jgi:nucleoside phosphorylase
MHGRSILVLFPTSPEAQFALGAPADALSIIETMLVGNRTDLRWLIIDEPSTHVWISVYFAACAKRGADIKRLAKDLIEDVKPHLVILPGIAGGARGRDYGIGDVIISDELMYVLEKKEAGETRYRVRIAHGEELGGAIARTNIGHQISGRLKVLGKKAADLSEQDLVDAARNAGVPVDQLSNVVAEAKMHFSRLASQGPRVGNAVVFSEYVNSQREENPLARLHNADYELQACEMEAIYVLEAMRELGRRDQPLLVKAISDIPGFLRSEQIKNFAREIAAHALREFLLQPELWKLIEILSSSPRFHRASMNALLQLPKHLELVLSDALPPDDASINFIVENLAKDPRNAAPTADLLDFYLSVCPRCASGMDKVTPYLKVFDTTFSALQSQPGESVRMASS